MKRKLSSTDIEDRIRRRLARRYSTPLEKGKLKIKGVLAEFDFVSHKQIIGQIKSSAPRRREKLKGKMMKQTQFGDFSRDCLLLAAKKAKIRLFVLTNGIAFREFCRSPQGKAAELLGIRILLERPNRAQKSSTIYPD